MKKATRRPSGVSRYRCECSTWWAAEAAEIVRHARGGVAVRTRVKEDADAGPQHAGREAGGGIGKAAERGGEGHPGGAGPAQGGRALGVTRWQYDVLDGLGGDGAVLRDAPCCRAPCGSRSQGVVKRRLGAERPAGLEVLLDAGALVVEADARLDTIGEDAGGEATRRAPADAALEEKLDPVGATEVEIVTNDFFEELASMHGAIEDLGQTDLELQNREHRRPPCAARARSAQPGCAEHGQSHR